MNEETKKLILTEMISHLFLVVAFSITWVPFVFFGTKLWSAGLWYLLSLLPFAVSLIYISYFALVVRAMPKLKPGRYRLKNLKRSKMPVIWFIHINLNRAGLAVLWVNFIKASKLLTFLYYRAFGADIAYNVNLSYDHVIADPGLVEIQENVVIGGRCYLGGHTIVKDMLVLAPIVIKQDALVSMNCVIGPNTLIGKSAIVGFGNILNNCELEDDAQLMQFEWNKGSPSAQSRFDKRMNKRDERIVKDEVLKHW